jgi:hypothetical protein
LRGQGLFKKEKYCNDKNGTCCFHVNGFDFRLAAIRQRKISISGKVVRAENIYRNITMNVLTQTRVGENLS